MSHSLSSHGRHTFRRRPSGIPPRRLILVTFALVAALVSMAHAQTMLSFDPSTSDVDCGETITVDVTVADVTDLQGLSIYIQYDPSIIEIVAAVAAQDFLAACDDAPFVQFYDPVGGVARIDAALLGCTLDTVDPASLITLSVTAAATKASSSLVIGGDTILRNSLNETIGFSTADGSVANICNTAPVVDPATFAVDENSPAGTVVGTVTASDADATDSLTFAITAGDPGGGFAIDPDTGEISVADPSELDHETTPSFALEVTATDDDPNGPLSGSAAITVDVQDVNEAPVVGDIPDQSILQGETFATIPLDDHVTDVDDLDEDIDWAATGQVELTVTIDANRVATITVPGPDWEGSETVTFTATDPGLLADSDTATFSMVGVNDPPDVTDPGDQTSTVQDEISLQIVADDPENDTLAYAATGLPPGLSIASDTGLITGIIECDAEGVYTVTATVTDDGSPPLAASVEFTWTVAVLPTPAALAEAPVAAPDLVGNDADGTTRIAVTWDDPGVGLTVTLYRKGFGGYPEYDDAGGAVPTVAGIATQADALAAGWTLVDGVTAPGESDEPETRDFWYYIAFVENACGQSSGPSAVSNGALNYLLGDFAPAGAGPPYGDNFVNGLDVSDLGDAYATADDGDPFYDAVVDIGPTSDSTGSGRPLTDDLIEFEDLILLAINYGDVVKHGTGPEPALRNLLTVYVPDAPIDRQLHVTLWVEGDGTVRGASVPLTWDPDVVRPVSMTPGELGSIQAGQTLLLTPEAGTVDVGLFGAPDAGLAGTGPLATVTFELVGAGDPGLGVGAIRARDASNEPVELAVEIARRAPDVTALPAASVLHGNHPNPFNPMTTVSYAVGRQGPVSLAIYDVRGRVVAELVRETKVPGEYTAVWDGTDATGRRVASGRYVARLVAPDGTEARSLTLVK